MRRIIILRLLESYFLHRWFYLLPIFVMIISGTVYFLTQERNYISSGVIYTEQKSMLASLTSVQSDGFSWNTPAQNTTYAISDLLRTDAFIRAVIQGTDLEAEMSKGDSVVRETIDEVRKSIWVSVAGINQVKISGMNPDPYIAYQLAQSTINTFIQWKINSDQTDRVVAVKFFRELIDEYKSEHEEARQALRRYLETHPEPVRGDRPDIEEVEIQNLQSELIFIGTRLSQAENKAEDARLAMSQVESNIRQKYNLFDAPDVPAKSATSKRQLAMNAAVFLTAGLLLSGFAVLGATVLEQSFRIPLDIRQALDLPVMAIVPDISGPVQKKRRIKRKRKEPVPLESDEHDLKKPEEVSPLPDLQMDSYGTVQEEQPGRRKKKELIAAESVEPTVEKLMFDLQDLNAEIKQEKQVR
jgi:capsular polysaccharide biosynthesis protein